jgi:hypothetical protein
MKASLGLKFGYLLKAYTKGKNMVTATGTSLYGKNYVLKEVEKHYFNTTRIAATARIGYGFISLDGSYQLTRFLKDAAGRPLIHGLSGLPSAAFKYLLN